MNRRMVLYRTGQILTLEGILLLLPLAVSVCYFEWNCVKAFAVASAAAFIIGFLLALTKPKNKVIYAREGFSIVTLAWIILSVIGAMPFILSGEIQNYADAFFETVSGFTTTGASILENVEAMSKGLLF